MRSRTGAVAALLAGALGLTACTGGTEDTGAPDAASPTSPASPASPEQSDRPTPTPTATPTPTPTRTPDPTPSGPPRVVGTVARGLAAPWGIDFLPGGDAIVTERDTRRVLRISGPDHAVRQVGSLPGAVPTGDRGGEAGVLGVAVSPGFDRDRLLYFYLSTATDNRIVSAPLRGGRLGATRVVLDGIPNGFVHDGGRLAFGPDGHLYASTGESGEPSLAQDRSSLGGKILRITPAGDPAPGNPFGSPVYSYGHRNVQGLAFVGRQLWASEFGQDTYDELNRVEAGADYGWPDFEGRGGAAARRAGDTDPQQVWATDDASPSGLAYADGHLWMAALKGERLWRVRVSGGRAVRPTPFFVGDYGRMRTVVTAPDGDLWVTTSNRDGRGDPRRGDDRILRIRP